MMRPVLEDGIKVVLSAERADGLACSADLYRYAAGEASPAEEEAFRAHLKDCEACRRDLTAFEREGARSEAAPAPRSWWRRTLTPGLIGAFATAAIIAGISQTRRTEHEFSGSLRTMGGYRLHVAVDRNGNTFTAGTTDHFLPGDVLGFFYTAPKATHLAVYLAEADGKISRLLPGLDDVSRPLPAATEGRLELGAMVDSTSGCQWLVAFFSPVDSSPQFSELEAGLRASLLASDVVNCQLGPLAPKGIATDILVMKVESR